MDKEFFNISEQLRIMLIKDMDLPISVIKDPYFAEQFIFLNKQYKTFEKLSLLRQALKNFENETELVIFLKTIREEVIDHIANKEEFKEFENFNIPQTYVHLSAKSIYTKELCNKNLISVDLKKANFNILRTHNANLVDNCADYASFIRQFTDLNYVITSKKIRQIIFGNLNPKRQQALQLRYVGDLALKLKCHFPQTQIISSSSDEFICEGVSDKYNEIKDFINNESDFCRVDLFHLEHIKSKKYNIYKKVFNGFDEIFELKCCPSPYVIEVLRHIYNEPLGSYDRYFYNDGRLCEYRDSLFDE